MMKDGKVININTFTPLRMMKERTGERESKIYPSE